MTPCCPFEPWIASLSTQTGLGGIFRQDAFFSPALVISRDAPHHVCVFNKSKGGDPMSSDFVFQNVASADCTFGKQSSR